MHRATPLFTTALAALIVAAAASAQGLASLENPSPADYEQFGFAVAVDGEWAAVGAFAAQAPTVRNGEVYMYRQTADGWALVQTLRPTPQSEFDLSGFGWRVALRGDLLAVAAPDEWTHWNTPGGDDDVRGGTYVFRRDGETWNLEARLSDERYSIRRAAFGIATDGERVAVGMRGYPVTAGGYYFCTNPPQDPGRAVVFARDSTGTWGRETVVLPSDSVRGADFGVAVALYGGRLAVGAPNWYDRDACIAGGSTSAGLERGKVYVYRLEDGEAVPEAELQPADPDDRFRFGEAVDLDADRVIVGAPYASTVGDRFGAAFVYARTGTTWALEDAFTGFDTGVGDQFGASVAIRGEYAAVGAPRYVNGLFNLGAAYAFRNTGGAWAQRLKITLDEATSPGAPYAGPFSLGASVAHDGVTILAGAPDDPRGHGTSGDRRGSAWTESLPALFAVVTAAGAPEADAALALGVPAPNPVAGYAAIPLVVGRASESVRVAIYDLLGREVAVIREGPLAEGAHVLRLEAGALPAGTYVVRAAAGASTAVRRLTVTR